MGATLAQLNYCTTTTNWLIIKEKNYAVAYNDHILCMSQRGMDRMMWLLSNVFSFICP
jgi:hypothetical protein